MSLEVQSRAQARRESLRSTTSMLLCRVCRRPHLSVSLQMIKCGGMRSLQGRCRSDIETALQSCTDPS